LVIGVHRRETAMAEPPQNVASDQANDRLDLVRRLFAVAISIGLGSTIVSADWVRKGIWPAAQDVQQIFIVLLALFATVLSWDGYLSSVRKKPLNDWPRFVIDVLLVFIYMFLIITSNKPWFWLPIICLMYSLYVIWDALSVWQYPATFDNKFEEEKHRRSVALVRVYVFAICNRPGIDRGPLISLMWAGYFFALLIIIWRFFPSFHVLAAVGFAAAGLAGYRRDKLLMREGDVQGVRDVRGLTIAERILAIGGLVALACLYGYLTKA
jgi:hypothetical protein